MRRLFEGVNRINTVCHWIKHLVAISKLMVSKMHVRVFQLSTWYNLINDGNRTDWSLIRPLIMRSGHEIGRPRKGSPITDRHRTTLPINHKYWNFRKLFSRMSDLNSAQISSNCPIESVWLHASVRYMFNRVVNQSVSRKLEYSWLLL